MDTYELAELMALSPAERATLNCVKVHGQTRATLVGFNTQLDPNERRTENEKKRLLATLRAGGLERVPLKQVKQERAMNCNLMSVVSGLGSLLKRSGRVGFPLFQSSRGLDTTLKGQGIFP
jgi:hypothetical protein